MNLIRLKDSHLKKIRKSQNEIVCKLNLKDLQGREKIREQVGKKLGKDIICLYDEDSFDVTDEEFLEEMDKNNRVFTQACNPKFIKTYQYAAFGSLSCILENMYGSLLFDTKRNELIESGIMENCHYWKCIPLTTSKGKNVFMYIYFSYFDAGMPQYLVDKYKNTYFERLNTAIRKKKIDKVFSVV